MCPAPPATTTASAAQDLTPAGDLRPSAASDVQWMVSGNALCSVPISANMRVAEVKAQVQQLSGIPAEEQRLFAGGEELDGDVDMSPVMEGVGSALANLKLVRASSDALETNLAHFRAPASSFPVLSSGEFTMVRKVASGIHGEVYKYQWRRAGRDNSDTVAVKKLKRTCLEEMQGTETDERKVHMGLSTKRSPSQEDALTEIGVLLYLAAQQDLPKYLLRVQGTFMDSRFVWLVTEFADGGELFSEVSSRGVPELQARCYMRQILEATAYLHRHCIAHRDISLENILLKDGEARVMDFGMAVRSHSSTGAPLRYFRAVGKDFYRAPECYVPTSATVDVVAPQDATPGAVVTASVHKTYLCEVRLPGNATAGAKCSAEVWGYAAQPVDVFAVGVCLFILLHRCPPWGKASFFDKIFTYVHAHGIRQLLQDWKMQSTEEALELLVAMIQPESGNRPTVEECLKSPWFAGLSDEQAA